METGPTMLQELMEADRFTLRSTEYALAKLFSLYKGRH